MKKGFTLIEILLSLSIIVIMAAISIPIYQSLQNTNNLDIAVNTVSQTLRRAQELSRSGYEDSAWGVYVENNAITLFKGSNYASRDTNFDEVFDIASIIVPSGMKEVVYSKFYGIPNTTGTLTLNFNTTSRTITINEKGTITY